MINGIGSIDTIHDCEAGNGILVRLTKEVDLDDLLVYLAYRFGSIDGDADGDRDWYLDDPTTLPGYPFLDTGRQAQVGWFRKQVCIDGDHSWTWRSSPVRSLRATSAMAHSWGCSSDEADPA